MTNPVLAPGTMASAARGRSQQNGLRKAWRLLLQVGLRLLPWLVVIFIWYLIPATGLVSPALVPTPLQVLFKFWEQLTTNRLWLDMYMSLQRVTVGLVCGIALAVPVGFLLGWYRPA